MWDVVLVAPETYRDDAERSLRGMPRWRQHQLKPRGVEGAMHMDGIYLLNGTGGLIEMPEQKYEAEHLLQKLHADYPSLLAGDQIDRASPRRWLLV